MPIETHAVTPTVKVLMSRQDMTKPTLENLLADINSDLAAKSVLLLNDFAQGVCPMTSDAVALTIGNNAKIVELLKQAIELQLETMGSH